MVPNSRIGRGERVIVTCSKIKRPSTVGEWLSLVEHLVRDQGVGGSNPLSPTNLFWVQPGHMGYTMYRLHG